jgi:hypothetical protein
MQRRDHEFADASAVVSASAIVRTLDQVLRTIEAEMSRSATASAWRRLRVTRVGVIITSACVTHAVLLQLLPEQLAPVKPVAYGMVVAFAALFVAAGFITTRSSATATAESSAGTANAMKS